MLYWLIHVLDHGSSICDEWCLHFWEMIGTWFTGFATFGAVAVSLLLARREGVRFRVSAGQFDIVGPGSERPYPKALIITVRNFGTRDATIEGVAWRRRPWGRLHALQNFAPTLGYPGPPVTVGSGKSHHFTLPLNHTEINWGEWFLKDFVGRWPSLGVRLVRIIAYTPAGVRSSASIDTSLRNWLIEKAAAMRAASEAH
ncbi:MAG TPA: hypothetical protein VGD63_21880 [Steroidobacteraceae bacterium]